MPSAAIALANAGPDDGNGMSHICRQCGKGFTSRWTLERHMNNHASVSAGEPV